jgi:indolepyruvate ferredoxin oxidoreductase beta subunit
VGGQGVLSIASVIARSAAAAGFSVRQSEVHGMAQRGGAVLAHLRLAGPGEAIHGDLVPRGGADLIISMEILESLRYLPWLSPRGVLVTALDAVDNIPAYPDRAELERALGALPTVSLVPAAALAKEAGQSRSVNMVMVGAASPFLPVPAETLERTVTDLFAARDPKLGELNRRAFTLGRGAGGSTNGTNKDE